MKHQWEKSQRSARGGAQRYPSLPNKKTPPQENRKQEHKKEKEAPKVAANTVEKTGFQPLDASAQLMDSNAWSVVKAIRTRLTSSKETEIEENSGHCSYQNRRCWRARRIQQRGKCKHDGRVPTQGPKIQIKGNQRTRSKQRHIEDSPIWSGS